MICTNPGCNAAKSRGDIGGLLPLVTYVPAVNHLATR